MPRDPNRIPRILRALEAAWRCYPDLRLGQLLCNQLLEDHGMYYVEDDEWERLLWEYAGREE